MIIIEEFVAARKAKGLSQPKLAKLAGVSQSLIGQIETDKVQTTKHIFAIARVLERRPKELDPEIDLDEHIPSEQVALGRSGNISPDEDPTKMPLFGAVEGGDGSVEMTGEVVQYVERPPELISVAGIYSLYVVGESMEPALRRGHRVIVNPNLPPKPMDTVVLLQDDPGTATTGLIKLLVKQTPKAYMVEQFNPAKIFSLDRADWPICHVVQQATYI